MFVDMGLLDAHWEAVPVCCACPCGVVQGVFAPTSDEVLVFCPEIQVFLVPSLYS